MFEFEEKMNASQEGIGEQQNLHAAEATQTTETAQAAQTTQTTETAQAAQTTQTTETAQAAQTTQTAQKNYSWIPESAKKEQTYGQANQTYGQANQPYGQGYRQNSGDYQQSAWSSQPHYNHYERQQANTQHTAPKKKTGSGKRWGAAVALALAFGLIAGSVTYGVNRAANYFFPIETQPEASVGEAVPERVHLNVAGSEATSYTEKAMAPANVEAAGTVAAVAYDAMPSLVTISTMSVQEMESFFGRQRFEAQGAGTGVIVGENDTELLIATNNHVVEDAQEVSIGFIDEEVVEAQIKGADRANDLAIVAVKLEDIPDDTMSQIKIATVGDSDALVLGEQVVAIGNALGVGQSVTSGYISALNRELELSDGFNEFVSSGLIQTDAAINSGNSGGALLNMKGELIGINEAKSAYTSSGVTVDNVGYAIPMSKAMPILEDLMNQTTREKYSEDEQGYLGVSLVNISSDFANLYGTPQGVGFAEVAEDSPAAEAGALKGDILTDFNGKTVTTVDDVLNEIQYYKSGEEVELTVLRADNGEYKEKKLTVTLGTKEAISTLQTQTQ